MRLSREDLIPILVIMAGGAVSVVPTLRSRSNDVPPPPVTVPAQTQDPSTRMVMVDRVAADGDIMLAPAGAVATVDELLGLQSEVVRDVRALPSERGAERSARIERLREQKRSMQETVRDLVRELDVFARGGWPDEPEAGIATSGVANFIRKSKLVEKIQYSHGTIQQWDVQSAVTLELTIAADLQALRDQMERAPLVYVEGVRIDMDAGTSVMWEGVVRGEERGIPMSVLQVAIDAWREATDTPASMTGGIESLEVLEGEAAIAVYGAEASRGVIQIFLQEPDRPIGN